MVSGIARSIWMGAVIRMGPRCMAGIAAGKAVATHAKSTAGAAKSAARKSAAEAGVGRAIEQSDNQQKARADSRQRRRFTRVTIHFFFSCSPTKEALIAPFGILS